LTAIRPVQLYLRDSGGMAEQTTGPIGNIYHITCAKQVKQKITHLLPG